MQFPDPIFYQETAHPGACHPGPPTPAPHWLRHHRAWGRAAFGSRLSVSRGAFCTLGPVRANNCRNATSCASQLLSVTPGPTPPRRLRVLRCGRCFHIYGASLWRAPKIDRRAANKFPSRSLPHAFLFVASAQKIRAN